MSAPLHAGKVNLRVLGWVLVLSCVMFAGVSWLIAWTLYREGPPDRCEGGVLRATTPPSQDPFGDPMVFGHFRVVAETQGQRITMAQGELGVRSARIELEAGGMLDVTFTDADTVLRMKTEQRHFKRLEDVPLLPRSTPKHVGADRYEVRLRKLAEGDPLVRCQRSKPDRRGEYYFVRTTPAERAAEGELVANMERTAMVVLTIVGLILSLLAGVGAALLLRRALRGAAQAPEARAPVLTGAALEGPALALTPLESLPEPFASQATALRARHAPQDHRVFFGAPGSMTRYLLAIAARLLIGTSMLTLLLLATAVACFIIGWTELARLVLALGLFGLIPIAALAAQALWVRHRAQRLRATPNDQAIAFGPDGILVLMPHLGRPKLSVIPYRDTLAARLVAPNSVTWVLAWGSSLLSSVAPRDLDTEAPLILQELRLAHRALELGQRVTSANLTNLAQREAAPWRAACSTAESLATLAERSPHDAPLGVWILPWSRPPVCAANQLALGLALMLPLVTLLPGLIFCLVILYSRGRRGAHRLVLLPDALLICQGTQRLVPYQIIQRLEPQGDAMRLHTTSGILTVDAGYRLTRSALERAAGRAFG
ncbi:MAG: hypothetical protein KF915_20275 [Polyangiaceae bacterium]|nr:hypothetical protein [Polyangiaceae bacterium]